MKLTLISSYVKKTLFAIALFTISASPAFAQNSPVDSRGVYNTGSDDVVTLSFISTIFENLLSIMLQLIGFGAFIMIIISAFQYLTAGEDQKKVQQSRATISYAIGGIALAFIAWFVLTMISNITSNSQLLEFKFGLF